MGVLGKILRKLTVLAARPAQAGDEAQPKVEVPPVALPSLPEPSPASTSSVRKLLALAQAEALDAFRAADLPDKPGTYRFDPGVADWAPLGTALTPAQRWEQVLHNPPEEGWRYAGLAQIGRRERPGDPVIALAADLLDQVSSSLARLDGDATSEGTGRHDLEVAFELTMTWMRLVEAVTLSEPDTQEPAAQMSPEPCAFTPSASGPVQTETDIASVVKTHRKTFLLRRKRAVT